MLFKPVEPVGIPNSGRARKLYLLLSAMALGLMVARAKAGELASEAEHTVDRPIPQTKSPEAESSRSANAAAATRVASVSNRPVDSSAAHASDRASNPAAGDKSPAATEPISQAKKTIAECKERYRQVRDYTCTFIKRERIDGRLTEPHMMTMKARTNPSSVYFKFHQPNRGREAIYVQGRNDGQIVAHDVGLGKFIAGTMYLDPRCSRAMEENRHPVTEAGIGALIDTVAKHWATELTPGESVVTFHHSVRVGERPCTMIESTHPRRAPGFLFYKVKLYVCNESGLPIRFEAYDWPRHAGSPPELVEEYSYLDLKTNVGLHDRDFDPANQQYSFGRF
jgi:hypothetical protein